MPPKQDPLLAEMLAKLTNIENKLDSQGKSLDEVKESLKISNRRIDVVEVETSDLKEAVGETKCTVEELRQQIYKNSIEIAGVPVTDGEDVLSVVIQICSHLNVSISKMDLNNAYRIGRRLRTNDKGQQFYPLIIVDFAREYHKTMLLSAVKQRDIPLTLNQMNCGFDGATSVYINEYLTPHNKRIYLAARRAKKSGHLKFVWIKHGKILGRREEQSPIMNFTNVHDVIAISDDTPVYESAGAGNSGGLLARGKTGRKRKNEEVSADSVHTKRSARSGNGGGENKQ